MIHSGQTGVERGAARAAKRLGLRVTGFSTTDGRDELGRIPDDVAADLTPCIERGPRSAAIANIQIATALVLLVPVAAHAASLPALATYMREARARSVPIHVLDPTADFERTGRALTALAETSGSIRIYITGPRATRWAEGERVATRFVHAALSDPENVVIR